ncbi:MAG: hypothetical protein KDA80_14455 [Planctomycetaceae bacterium]|nr:hypothetical protein [Planctomycetaceae bacterium]
MPSLPDTICRSSVFALVLVISSTIAPAQTPDEATQLMVGLKSTDQVLSDLEYVVSTLAGKKESYEDNIYLNIEVFAFGLAWDRVVRFDSIFDPEHGRQLYIGVPLESLDAFFEDNLEPIGINPQLQRSDRNLYKLTGNVYQGWLRNLPEPVPYAGIFPQKEFISKEMVHPQKQHEALEKEGWLAFLKLENDANGIKQRQDSMKAVRENALKDFQKTPDESREEYELRKRMREHTLTILEQWLVESQFIKLGLKVNQKEHTAPSSFTFHALPETSLHTALERIGEPRYFGAIASPEDPVLSLRGNIPIDEGHQAAYLEIYEMARPVAKERIDGLKKASATEKSARQEVTTLLLDVLSESIKLGKIDGFMDVTGEGNAHTLTMGIVCSGKDKIAQILEKLPAAQDGWSLEKDVDKAGDLTVHKLSLGDDVPKSLTDFYGDSKAAYVAVSDEAFWLGLGDGALKALKENIETVSAAKVVEPDNVMLSLNMHAQPVLKNVFDFTNESDLELIQIFQSRRTFRGTGEGNENRRRRVDALADFEWEQAAIDAMEGLDDRFEIELHRTEPGKLSGGGNAQQGVLKAVGAVIAKFADENLR